MAGIVTALRFQEHTTDRVNVFLDGKFAFGLPALVAARLRVGQTLSDADIAGLQAADVEQRAYDRAVRALARRPHSEAELRQRLTRAGVAPDVIAAVLARLTREGYLDDAAFARFWVEERERFRPRSPAALAAELRHKGVAADVIEEAVTDLDPQDSAYQAARPYARRIAHLAHSDRQAFRRKVGDFLTRRGYDYETVRVVTGKLLEEVGEDGDPLTAVQS